MTRAKGNQAAGWVAAYLTRWFPLAEKTPNGRPGRDVMNTPGLAVEVKTSAEWRPKAWAAQVARYPGDGELGLLVYLPPGCGQRSVPEAMALLPLRAVMPLLVAAGYAPEPAEEA